jgi:DNA-binding CsgD family transcriptional regulator
MNKNANPFALARPGAAASPAILLGDSRTDLIAANETLREDLARQRALARDLRNVLFSLDVPALFLDRALKIRVFTPAASVLFGLFPGDVAKSAAQMPSLAVDGDLQDDSRAVLRGGAPVEREFQTARGAWFARRAMPYRAQTGSIDGVVVTFVDIGERKRQAEDLADAGDALRRFARDLTPMRDLLARIDDPARAREILARLDRKLDTLAGRLGAGDGDSIGDPMDAEDDDRADAPTIELALPADMPDAEDSARRLDGLSERQREILDLVLAGHPSKNIAVDLAISRRTVEGHRAAIMKRLGVKCLPALARMAMAAAMSANAQIHARAAAAPPA